MLGGSIATLRGIDSGLRHMTGGTGPEMRSFCSRRPSRGPCACPELTRRYRYYYHYTQPTGHDKDGKPVYVGNTPQVPHLRGVAASLLQALNVAKTLGQPTAALASRLAQANAAVDAAAASGHGNMTWWTLGRWATHWALEPGICYCSYCGTGQCRRTTRGGAAVCIPSPPPPPRPLVCECQRRYPSTLATNHGGVIAGRMHLGYEKAQRGRGGASIVLHSGTFCAPNA